MKVPKLDVNSIRAPMQALHASGENQSYQWRMDQLRRMKKLVVENCDDLAEALYSDLGKSRSEAFLSEMNLLQQELNLAISELRQWMKPRKVPSPSLLFPAFSKIVYKPKLGPACLVIGPSNFPLLLCLQPAIGALAAGNPVVIKPSELTPHTSELLQKLCEKYFEKSAVKVVQGRVDETKALLEQPWGTVFFTGSTAVGRKVAEAAARTLTPTVLELGGKCPCYVDKSMPKIVSQVADRIIWAKCLNSGQVCVTVDTLIVHKDVVDSLVPALLESIKTHFPDPVIESEMGRICSPHHAGRLVDLITEVEGSPDTKILCGGSSECRVDECFIAPTIILNPPSDCRVMQEEIFGPILPIVTVESKEEAIEVMHRMNPIGAPLSLCVFTTRDSVLNDVSNAVPSGSVLRNDMIVHTGSLKVPFGGLGTSGYGNYHGRFSFETFSHQQAVVYRPVLRGADVGNMRCHPYGDPRKGDLNVGFKSKALRVITMQSFPEIPLAPRGNSLLLLVVAVSAILSPRTAALSIAKLLKKVSDFLIERFSN